MNDGPNSSAFERELDPHVQPEGQADPSLLVQRLLTELDLASLCDRIVCLSRDVLHVEQVALYLCDPADGYVWLADAVGLSNDDHQAWTHAVWLSFAAQSTSVGATPVLTFDGSTLCPFVPGQSHQTRVLCAPLVLDRSCLGSLWIGRTADRLPLSPQDVELLLQIAGYTVIGLRNAWHCQRTVQLEKLKGMGRLVASLAHEINNPLQAVKNALDLLAFRALDTEKRERYLRMAHNEAGQLVLLVQRMLELYRPPGGGTRVVSLHELLEAVLLGVVPQLDERGIVLLRDWDPHLPRVREIGAGVKQVFLNLVCNAIEAMPGGGVLTIRTRTVERPFDGARTFALVEFCDTGPGIPHRDLQRIFEPFYTTRHGRVGLGLATSYSIIEQHAGRLSASSSESGAIFRVALPAL
jgi:signal transduction histidine kinase